MQSTQPGIGKQPAPIVSDKSASAEVDALRADELEEAAQRGFESVRARLDAQGRADEARQQPEFLRWMEARVQTDEAWRLWALATHG